MKPQPPADDAAKKKQAEQFLASLKQWNRYALNKPTLALLTGTARKYADGLVRKGYMQIDADGNLRNTVKGGKQLKRMRKRAKRHKAEVDKKKRVG